MLDSKAKAKRAALNMWIWLRDHPNKGKDDYKKADNWLCQCALCEYLHAQPCLVCPLYRCVEPTAPYEQWRQGKNRVENAQHIIDFIKAW